MNSPIPTDSESVCTNAAMRRATRRLGQLYDDALEASGMKATQLGLMDSIQRMHSPTMRTLAEYLVMDLSALGHTLKPLVRDGYVALTPHDRDKRAKVVTLTGAGQAKLDEGMALWLVAHQRFELLFGEDNARQLRRMLDQVASPGFEAEFNKV